MFKQRPKSPMGTVAFGGFFVLVAVVILTFVPWDQMGRRQIPMGAVGFVLLACGLFLALYGVVWVYRDKR